MQRRRIGIPPTAIKIISIFGKSRQIADSEIRTARGPDIVIRSRLAEIIETCPNEFSDHPRFIILESPIIIGKIRPRTSPHIIRTTLRIFVHRAFSLFDREFIYPARTDGRSRFRTQNHTLRHTLVTLLITMQTVIQAWDIENSCKLIFHRMIGTIHTHRYRPSRIFTMTYIL